MNSTSGIVCFILLFVNIAPSTQECNMELTINKTTECTLTFTKMIGYNTQSFSKNPEKLCWNFCKLEVCQARAAEETGCAEPAQYIIENSLGVARVLLQKKHKVNCENYDTTKCGRSSVSQATGFTIVLLLLLTRWCLQ
ncbi:uncharacterized protein LOC106467940 [Limulus polyphemus]|uniref:Uncharacterized protein LOC106467940 n=1 Tax=Limulus polyphemus TaxID=6850 RepID=A0ABM1BKG3_LIMPO|nr:uncharacterized protein LOC106467940 [Limulus polyphemus]